MPCSTCGADVINPMGTSHQNSRRHQDALGLHSSAAAAPRRSVAKPVPRRPAHQQDYFDQIFTNQQTTMSFPQQPPPMRRAPPKKAKAPVARRPKAPVQQVQQFYDDDEEGEEDDQEEQLMF